MLNDHLVEWQNYNDLHNAKSKEFEIFSSGLSQGSDEESTNATMSDRDRVVGNRYASSLQPEEKKCSATLRHDSVKEEQARRMSEHGAWREDLLANNHRLCCRADKDGVCLREKLVEEESRTAALNTKLVELESKNTDQRRAADAATIELQNELRKKRELEERVSQLQEKLTKKNDENSILQNKLREKMQELKDSWGEVSKLRSTLGAASGAAQSVMYSDVMKTTTKIADFVDEILLESEDDFLTFAETVYSGLILPLFRFSNSRIQSKVHVTVTSAFGSSSISTNKDAEKLHKLVLSFIHVHWPGHVDEICSVVSNVVSSFGRQETSSNPTPNSLQALLWNFMKRMKSLHPTTRSNAPSPVMDCLVKLIRQVVTLGVQLFLVQPPLQMFPDDPLVTTATEGEGSEFFECNGHVNTKQCPMRKGVHSTISIVLPGLLIAAAEGAPRVVLRSKYYCLCTAP
ncbi:hypothetical protein HDU96_009902 [Phlyctochytrium bullatum]|nr:hypothetical protein HDU96_009902 [Phlyctochytrium bullatum]